jgi:hypothetical protein
MEKQSINQATEEQKRYVADLVHRCVAFVERNGEISRRYARNFPGAISMRFQYQNITIELAVLELSYTHGSYFIVVKEKKRIMLKASGKLMHVNFDLNVKKYIPGSWEKIVPSRELSP